MLLAAAAFLLVPRYGVTPVAERPVSVTSDAVGDAFVVSADDSGRETTEFITKLDPEGTVVYRVSPDPGMSVSSIAGASDGAGDLYVVFSATPFGGGLAEGYLAKIDAKGNVLFHEPIPGPGGKALAIGSDGSIYITGMALPEQLATTAGAWVSSAKATPEQYNAFVTKVSPDGGRVVYTTFLDNSATVSPDSYAYGSAIGVDSNGDAFVGGNTDDPQFPATAGAYGGMEARAFLVKLKPDGSGAVYSTFLSGGDTPAAIRVDGAGNLQLTIATYGETSGLPPTGISTVKVNAQGAQAPDLVSISLAPFLTSTAGALAAVPDGQGNFVVTGQAAPETLPLSPGAFANGETFLSMIRGSDRAILFSTRLPPGAGGVGVELDGEGGFLVLGGEDGSLDGRSFSTLTRFSTQLKASPAVLGVGNVAGQSLSPGLAPGELISIYGTGLSAGEAARASYDPGGILPLSLAGTTVTVNGVAAPILYASGQQVDAAVPFEVSGSGTVEVVVTSGGQVSNNAEFEEVATEPEIWRQLNPAAEGYGYAIAMNGDGTMNSREHPAKAGEIVTVFVNGGGNLTPAPRDGARGNAGAIPVAALTVRAGLGYAPVWTYVPCDVLYAGSAPGEVAGKLQVNFRLPSSGLPAGAATPIEIQVGEAVAPAAIWTVGTK